VTLPRPRVLFLAHRVPYPPNRGDRIRSFHILRFLAERADVSLAYLAEECPSAETQRALKELCRDVAGLQLGRFGRWGNAARSMVLGRTATEGMFRCRRLRRLLTQWCQRTRFDAAVVFCSSMVQYLDVPGLAGVPAIVDLVDVDSQKWFDYARDASGVQRRLFQIEGRRLRQLEQSLPARVKAVTLVSSCEVDLYRSFCPTDCVHAIGNGVNLDYFRPSKDVGPASSCECVFVGALDYRANIDGIRWFCDEIWPEVRRREPRATFTIVGSRPSPVVHRLASLPGVRVASDVPDVRPYLAKAAVVVVPLRVARGIQNKVLEALAMGKAVVASPEALEGIAIEPGVHASRAGNAAEWIESAIGLFADAAARSRLGQTGRAFVEAHHCWSRQLAPLAGLLGLDVAHGELSGDTGGQDVKNSLAACHG
jgi:polysaccharide biosynthesis protein PslH